MIVEAFTASRPVASCTNERGTPKRAWTDQGKAFAVAQQISAGNTDGRVRPYRCGDCGKWHIGHARKQEDRQMSQKGTIVKLLAERDAIDPIDLNDRITRAGVSTNARTVVLLLWDLQKQGLVDFHERSHGGAKVLHNIRLTDRGRTVAAQADPLHEEGTKVPTLVKTIADRIEAKMIEAGSGKTWSPTELAEALELGVKYPGQTVSSTLAGASRRFVRATSKPGHWTLRIWRDAQPAVTAPLGVDRSSASNTRAGLVAPGGPVIRVRDSQPVAVAEHHSEPLPQNEKPPVPLPDIIDGLALVAALVERSAKKAQLVEAARMLEAVGEDELAIATLGKVELTALEEEVVELVRRFRGQATNASGQVRPGHPG